MNRFLLFIFALILPIAAFAEPAKTTTTPYDWQAPAVRLTCLPGQDFAVLEPFYLSKMPRQNTQAYAQDLAKQGIYVGVDMTKPTEDLPLKASCNLGNHRIEAHFT